jgi:hypothetical protein
MIAPNQDVLLKYIGILFVFSAIGCNGSVIRNDSPTASREDASLLARVKEAVEKEIGVEHVVQFVGRKPYVIAREHDDRKWLGISPIVADKEHNETIPDLFKAPYFVFWDRPIDFDMAAKAVGIVYKRDGTLEVVWGLLCPPESTGKTLNVP